MKCRSVSETVKEFLRIADVINWDNMPTYMVKCISPKINMQGIKKFVPARMKITNYSLK
jgi:hypothetical protein